MSHRKFEHPRCGSLGFLPRKKARTTRQKPKAFPADNQKLKPHLTAFAGYKAGMTHVVREVNRSGSKLHKKEIVEPVTILETPPMVVVGIVGYTKTPFGLKTLATVWAQHLSAEVRRRFYKSWYSSKKAAFKNHTANYHMKKGRTQRAQDLDKLAAQATVIRVLAHTQIGKVSVGAKKAHLMEIQVNGGSIANKVKFAYQLLEKTVAVNQVFSKNEAIDTISTSKGKGFKGVISRWGVTRLPRKTHKGLRKVACIGAWHPARVSWTVARAGQKGFFRRVAFHKKIYIVGSNLNTEEGKTAGTTAYDLTRKSINPVGGFPNYGVVTEDFLVVKGSVPGPFRRVVTLRKALHAPQSRAFLEDVVLKFVDTSSKVGRGRFQTLEEKKKFMGPLKTDLAQKRREDVALSRTLKADASDKKAAKRSA